MDVKVCKYCKQPLEGAKWSTDYHLGCHPDHLKGDDGH